MSVNRKSSQKGSKRASTPEKVEEEPVLKKNPKDRSALVGLKRNRKSRDQIQAL